MALRDTLVVLVILSAVEAYALLHFAPEYKPRGGLGRLAEWFIVFNSVLLFAYRWIIYPKFFSPLRSIPGPSGGLPILGQGLSRFALPRGEIFLKWVNSIPNDGLICFQDFFGRHTLIPTTAETLKTVLSEHTYDYEKPVASRTILRKILGDGLIVVEGDIHKFQRKREFDLYNESDHADILLDLMPAFQLKHIRGLYPMFWSKSCELVGDIDPKKLPASAEGKPAEVEFGEWCSRATLDIIGIAGFGRDFNSLKTPGDPLIKEYGALLEPEGRKLFFFGANMVLPQIFLKAFALIPGTINDELIRVQRNLNNFAMDIVKERRAQAKKSATPEGSDILSLLVNSNDFTDHELSDQVLTMMAAGHETTSSALSWAAYLMANRPDLQSRIREEVRANLPSPDSSENITATQIDSLPFLNAACLETLRLYPTVPMTAREVIHPTTLGGYVLPIDTRVMLVPWAINRSNHFWGSNAGEFHPDRWINGDGTLNKNGGSNSNFAQLTFLHGQRSCIGQG